MVFLGIVGKIKLKYSKELLDSKVKNRKKKHTYYNNKKTPEGAYAGCVGLRKNYGYVGWKWKLSSVCNKCVQERRRCSVKD